MAGVLIRGNNTQRYTQRRKTPYEGRVETGVILTTSQGVPRLPGNQAEARRKT